MHNINEEFGYAQELLATIIAWGILVPIFIGFGFGSLYNPEIPSIVSPIAGVLLCIISFMISFGYPVSLAYSKMQIELLDVPKFKTIEDILHDEKAHERFKIYLQKCYAVENLLFLENVIKFKNLTNKEAIQKEAEHIINLFIKKGAKMKLNLRDNKKTNRFVEDFPNNLSTTMFDNFYDEVSNVLRLDKLGDFLLNDHEMSSYLAGNKITESIQTHKI